MTEYVQTFGRIVLVVDVAVLIVVGWFLVYNFFRLFKYKDGGTNDVRYRCLMFVAGLFYFNANKEAFTRHIHTFIVTKVTTLNHDTVDSLLSDRMFMLGTGIVMLLLTYIHLPKWLPVWFKK